MDPDNGPRSIVLMERGVALFFLVTKILMTMTLKHLLLLLLSAFYVVSASIPILPFDYDADSPQGPLAWPLVDTDGNEWEKFTNRPDTNLDISGNECRSIRRPSPINLVVNGECRANHEILTREIRFDDCTMQHTKFYRTPHTLRADLPLNDDICRRPTIDLPNGYPYRWFLHHLEVHLRAEHVLDGRRFDGEIQQYHLGQQDQKREMATVSILLDASGFMDNPKLQEYIDRWQVAAQEEVVNCTRRRRRSLRNHDDSLVDWTNASYNATGLASSALKDPEHIHSVRSLVEEEVDENGWPLSSYAPRRKMYPYDLWPTIYHYRYRGSITSPPCSEIVSWRVLDEPLIISRRQYKTLARLLNTHVNPETCQVENKLSSTGENFRPLQELNQRAQEVVHCTSEDFGFNMYPPNQQ